VSLEVRTFDADGNELLTYKQVAKLFDRHYKMVQSYVLRGLLPVVYLIPETKSNARICRVDAERFLAEWPLANWSDGMARSAKARWARVRAEAGAES
jgi:hypothetical protein